MESHEEMRWSLTIAGLNFRMEDKQFDSTTTWFSKEGSTPKFLARGQPTLVGVVAVSCYSLPVCSSMVVVVVRSRGEITVLFTTLVEVVAEHIV